MVVFFIVITSRYGLLTSHLTQVMGLSQHVPLCLVINEVTAYSQSSNITALVKHHSQLRLDASYVSKAGLSSFFSLLFHRKTYLVKGLLLEGITEMPKSFWSHVLTQKNTVNWMKCEGNGFFWSDVFCPIFFSFGPWLTVIFEALIGTNSYFLMFLRHIFYILYHSGVMFFVLYFWLWD